MKSAKISKPTKNINEIQKTNPSDNFNPTHTAFVFACEQTNTDKKVIVEESRILANQEMAIDTFSTFPPEIDGCACYFSNNSVEFKKHKYIYINNYAKNSFLKINGVLTKFAQTIYKTIDSLNTKAVYKSETYQMIIESKDNIQSGEETWLTTGTIKLTDQKGKTIVKTFYGECGC